MKQQPAVYFAHGKESGPWGTKISALAAIARMKGFHVERPDFSAQPDPELRVDQLMNLRFPTSDRTVLVGSSMGGYVATVASLFINPVGLFLMAPAFNSPGYRYSSPAPHARKTVIVHGLKDEVIPAENSIHFAREHGVELHLIDGDHSLNDQLPQIEMLFDLFLDDVLELSDLPKILTWEKLSQKFNQKSDWVARIWEKMALAGYANYRNETERKAALLRFIALVDYYSEFLSRFSRDFDAGEPEDTAALLDLPHDFLEHVLVTFIARRKSEHSNAPTIQMALEEIAQESIYPTVISHYGNIEGIAASIYQASYPTFFDEDAEEYLTDPEDLDAEENGEIRAFEEIHKWLNIKFAHTGMI